VQRSLTVQNIVELDKKSQPSLSSALGIDLVITKIPSNKTATAKELADEIIF